MKNKLPILGAMLALGGVMQAQSLQTGYVTNPAAGDLANYVTEWKGGAGQLTVNSQVWEDEEFFTSRIKPRTRIERYGAGDVYNFQSDVDKRVMWWVPIGDPQFWAIPNSKFDSEVFSMWSYIDHFGSFSNPYGWVDAAFADAAHKNGVGVSGAAGIPQASIPAAWASCLNGLQSINATDATKIGKFMLYYGVDGLGYNSEFSGAATEVSNIMKVHNSLYAYMKDKNPVFENVWYDGTNDSGSCSFDSFLSGKTGIFAGASMFGNYNWNSNSLAEVPSRAQGVRKSDPRAAFYYYAGCNMQGGEPKSYTGAYSRIATNNVSLGYWGAHSRNMFWEGRGAGGTSSLARQQYYLNQCETFFTNGQRNPAVQMDIIDNKGHRPSDDWQGISKYRNAASALNHDISKEPFYSFFNLGNGTFFNWKGQRLSNEEWYSLGVQDYLPTWRFWFAPTFMGTNVAKGSQGLQADFTWEDAYVGGSCLKISGTAADEYLHLFKSAFVLSGNNKIVIRYRLLNGEADINLVLSQGKAPATAKTTFKEVLTVASSSDAADQSYDTNSPDRWVTKVFNVSSAQAKSYTAANGGVGVVALQFQNAKNLEILLGEVGIYPSSSAAAEENTITNSTTPTVPAITKTTILAYNEYGVDAKLVWTLDGGAGRAAGTPVYNADKGVSMFKMYSQEEGAEPTFVGVTTSWAGLLYKCPVTIGSNKKIRFGVRAVSADTRSESAIAWSEYMNKPGYTLDENVTIDKPVLKANESFTFGFIDPSHASAEWTLVDEQGTKYVQESGHTITVAQGLPHEGGYTLYINKDQVNERAFPYFVQVSGPEVGALPEIFTISRDGQEVTDDAPVKITLNERPVLSYTGRSSDGNASRAVTLESCYFGPRLGDLGIQGGQSFSVSGWFRFKEIPSLEWHFMNVSDRLDAWPRNEWGWSWNYGTPEGGYGSRFRGGDGGSPGEVHYTFPDVKFQAGIWTHIAWICEYTTDSSKGTGFRHQLYINGIKQKSTVTWWSSSNGSGGEAPKTSGGITYRDVDGDTFVWGQTYAVKADQYVYFGGPKHSGAAVDGVVDDFQIWNKAMSASDVAASMSGFPEGYPAGMLAMWDFESAPNEQGEFLSKGTKQGVKCGTFYTDGSENPDEVFHRVSSFAVGCPFLSGTAMPVKTKATWVDNYRQTNFATADTDNEGVAGSAAVSFNDEGDHLVKLALENLYGEDEREFPVFTISEMAGIEGVDSDAEGFEAYTEDNVLFLEFAADGVYDVQVYNVSGMLVAAKELSALAGQSAQVTLSAPGVYLVKAVKDGKVLRTIKVLSK